MTQSTEPSSHPPIPLSRLEPQRRYRIASIETGHAAVRRLMVLGLVEGAEIELASAAIGGDPVEFRVHGVSLSLRREQADHFMVTALT